MVKSFTGRLYLPKQYYTAMMMLSKSKYVQGPFKGTIGGKTGKTLNWRLFPMVLKPIFGPYRPPNTLGTIGSNPLGSHAAFTALDTWDFTR